MRQAAQTGIFDATALLNGNARVLHLILVQATLHLGRHPERHAALSALPEARAEAARPQRGARPHAPEVPTGGRPAAVGDLDADFWRCLDQVDLSQAFRTRATTLKRIPTEFRGAYRASLVFSLQAVLHKLPYVQGTLWRHRGVSIHKSSEP